MMGKRHETIGIKQVIRFEWMQKTVNLLLAGLDYKTIRQELHSYLLIRRGDGSEGDRGATSRTQVVNMLMNIWVDPDTDLLPFRDDSLTYLQKNPAMALAVHWGMISVAYPFWFNMAKQAGRLLALQNQATQTQIINRLKEQYGDRQTVSRYARYIIRSLVAWSALKDSETKGCYQKVDPIKITDVNLAILMFESALLAVPEAVVPLGTLINNPALFPFQLPNLACELISQHSERIDLVRYGLDDAMLKLKGI